MASKKKSKPKAKPVSRREVKVTKRREDDEVQQDRTEQSGQAQRSTPEEVDRAVEQMSQVWSSAVPEAALQEDHYELPENDSLRRLKNDKVPDGSYRVTGHEWILEYSGGSVVAVEHVTENTDHDGYTSIPQPRET